MCPVLRPTLSGQGLDMKKHVLAAILGASMLFSAQAGTLHVGTEATFAPFEFMDEQTKELTGFDMELITAVAKAMGDDVKIQNMGFDGLIPSLQTRIIDVTAAAMTITPERVKRIDFSEPYYQSGLVILVKKDNLDKVKDLDSLQGKTICAQIGTTGAMMAKHVKDAKVTEYNSITEAFLELKQGGCLAVINDKPVVDYYLARRGDETVTTLPQVFDAEYYGFGVKKGNKEMVAKLNEGLKKVRESGEYDRIYQKWFGTKAQ